MESSNQLIIFKMRGESSAFNQNSSAVVNLPTDNEHKINFILLTRDRHMFVDYFSSSSRSPRSPSAVNKI